jgi:hypothetical protein
MPDDFRVIFTIYSTPEYHPIKIVCRLPEYETRVLMATPIKSVSVAVHRAGGMVMDSTPVALDFYEGGNVPK